MRLNAKELIAGHPILSVRNALRRVGLWFEADDMANLLKTSPGVAVCLMTELEKRGWCQQHDRSGWEITSNGMTFLNATAGHPISRTTAKLHLRTVAERTAKFHLDFPDWPVRIDTAAVFGSYLTDAEKLGDLDVALKLTRVHTLMQPAHIKLARTVAENSGYRCRTMFDRAGGFLDYFVVHRLGEGLRSVSFHGWADIDELQCKHEVFWTHPLASSRAGLEQLS